MSISELTIILAIGLAAGFLSGSMGVGGGVIIVPSLIFFMGFSLHHAQGTSLALMTIPVMLVATVNFYKQDYVDVKVALLLAVTFVVGGYLGSKFSFMMPEKMMKKAFGVLMLFVALKMIFSK